jgi:hypothetical protein
MAKHDRDPVLRELIRRVNDSGQTAVPVTLSVHGAVLHASLISQDRYFAELAETSPLMSALDPGSGLLGDEYVKDVASESHHYLHVRAARLAASGDGAEGLWRLRLDAVDAWTLRIGDTASDQHDKGPFARLLGNP